MLKGIPSILSPDLLKTLLEMGHGDELVIADGNFPAASTAARVLRCDGNGVPPLLEALLQFFPLDPYVPHPVVLMEVEAGDSTPEPPIWKQYARIIQERERAVEFQYLPRQVFYERARRAFAVVATSEPAIYANLILKKGVVA